MGVKGVGGGRVESGRGQGVEVVGVKWWGGGIKGYMEVKRWGGGGQGVVESRAAEVKGVVGVKEWSGRGQG